MATIDYVVLVGYFIMMAGIGLACMRLVKKQEDYFMGGRSFGKLLQTFAAFGAGTGANDPIQVGRTTWTSGLSGIWSVLLWLFVTPFYWIFAVWYRRMRHLTLGDWFVERYDSTSLGAGYTIFGFCFYMVYLSTMFSAIGKVAASIMNVQTVEMPGFGEVGLEYVLVPVISVVVIVYGVLGGLRAAYWTDLIQGLCIIMLSLLLIPSGLTQLVEKFGDTTQQQLAAQQGAVSPAVWYAGFDVMHDRVTDEYFEIFGGPRAGEFPLHYIVSLTLLGLVGIVVQPHFIATGGGSAKTENGARIGLVTGNFLKRFCTIGWALTGLILIALLAGEVEAARDPDRIWGVATRRILGPLGIGLVGLMLACLLAALMSSADCYMIVTAGLVVRNIYAPYIDPNADEKTYVRAGRIASLIVIVGAATVSLYLMDVFGQFKIALEVAIVFAAPFWIGMFWRRANAYAAWLTIAFSALMFFIIPILAPVAMPSLRTSPAFAVQSDVTTIRVRREATEADVEKRQAAIALWNEKQAEIEQQLAAAETQAERDQALAALDALGSPPTPLQVGEEFIETLDPTGGKAIFWSEGLTPLGEMTEVAVAQRIEEEREITVTRRSGKFLGQGMFNLDFLLYQAMGMDLRKVDSALYETLRLPPRLITPFIVMILLSLVTPRTDAAKLDRYYVKMKTPV
ncbi:MAG: hypothetical protein KY475_15475, partial [Planctomycetes bacterium]|nr:hypothetical protein [Planctomycetota bacterium]